MVRKIPIRRVEERKSRLLESVIKKKMMHSMKYTSCHLNTKLTTWFGLAGGVETKSNEDCVFDTSKQDNNAMTCVLQHLTHSG